MKSRFWIALLLVASIAAFLGLGRGDVVTDNEGQRAAPPATMLRTGDYIIPMKSGEPYLVKPPLLYWAVAGVYSVFGVSEFTARTPTAICGVLLIMSVYLFLRREAGERAARWGALALLASPYVFERIRYAELDIPLTLATFLSIVCARNATISDRRSIAWAWCVAAGLAFGAAVLLKGPVPFLFVWAAAVAVFVVRSTERDRIVRWGITLGIAAFLLECVLTALAVALPGVRGVLSFPVALIATVLAWSYFALRYCKDRARIGYWIVAVLIGCAMFLPWGIAVLQRMGWEYLSAMLDNQVVERTHTASEINGGWPWYFVVGIAGMIAPWSLLIPFQFSKREWNRHNELYQFCLVMAWLSVLVFSLIAGKEYEYILPCLPFLVLAIGYHLAEIDTGMLARWMDRWVGYWQRIMLALLAIVLPAAAIYCTIEYSAVGFIALIWALAVFGVFSCALAVRSRTFRTTAVLIATLCSLLVYLNARGESNQGPRSPRELANTTERYVKAGYTVETSEVYPAFEFYADSALPLERSPERVREKFAGKEPYLYVTREGRLKAAGIKDFVVFDGPIAFKEMMLIGNQIVPPADY